MVPVINTTLVSLHISSALVDRLRASISESTNGEVSMAIGLHVVGIAALYSVGSEQWAGEFIIN